MKTKIKNLFVILMVTVSLGILSSCSSGKPEIEWVDIPAGTFIMGSPEDEHNRRDDEKQYEVRLDAFKMSKYEVTVAQFKAFVDATNYVTDAEQGHEGFSGSTIWLGDKFERKAGIDWKCDIMGNILKKEDYNLPVVHVSWNDAKAFADWMGCRLPTEAEWEYAARAGSNTPFHTGNCISADQANYNANYPAQGCEKGLHRANLVPVGSFPPNQWGLFDMHGNVTEWCNDVYGEYPVTPQTNPKGPDQGINFVMRGGSWLSSAVRCRAAARDSYYHQRRFCFVGFRIVK